MVDSFYGSGATWLDISQVRPRYWMSGRRWKPGLGPVVRVVSRVLVSGILLFHIKLELAQQ